MSSANGLYLGEPLDYLASRATEDQELSNSIYESYPTEEEIDQMFEDLASEIEEAEEEVLPWN